MERRLSEIALHEGAFVEAQTRAEQSRALYRQVADRQGEARAAYWLGEALSAQHKTDLACASFQESLTLSEQTEARPDAERARIALQCLTAP